MIKERLDKSNIEFLSKINWEIIALDTETTSLDWKEQELLGISICDGEYAFYCDTYDMEVFYKVVEQLKSSKIIICHNIKFDMKVLYKYGLQFLWDKEWIDTMVMAHLINEEGDHALKDLAKSILKYDNVMTWEEAKKDETDFVEYAINDAIYTWELSQYFMPLIVDDGIQDLFRTIEMPFLKVLSRMEMNGVLVDVEKVNEVTTDLKDLIADLELDMLDILGEKYDMQCDLEGNMKVISSINFNSSDHLSKILFDRLKLEPVKITETGKSSTGRETINKLKDKHPFVGLLNKYKTAQKLLSAFFEPMPEHLDNDNRIRPNFNDVGTATGRLSCSNPNLQQLPKENKELDIDTRSCFIASPGKTMIAVDYSQQELRIMAQLSNDEHLVKIINEGGDLHLINANNVFGLNIPEEELYATHARYAEHKIHYKQHRDYGKVFSFGVAYGMGPHKLSRDFNVPIAQAEEMLAKFFSGFPELEKTIKDTHIIAEKQLYVATMWGRRRHFQKNQWGKLDSKALRQAFNFLIQSMGADVIRSACIKLDKLSTDNPELGIVLLMTIHDEIVLECNSAYTSIVEKQCKALLESVAKDFVCPLIAESGNGINYGEAK